MNERPDMPGLLHVPDPNTADPSICQDVQCRNKVLYASSPLNGLAEHVMSMGSALVKGNSISRSAEILRPTDHAIQEPSLGVSFKAVQFFNVKL